MKQSCIIALSYLKSNTFRTLHGVWIDLYKMFMFLENNGISDFKSIYIWCDFKYEDIPSCVHQSILKGKVDKNIINFYENFKYRSNVFDIHQDLDVNNINDHSSVISSSTFSSNEYYPKDNSNSLECFISKLDLVSNSYNYKNNRCFQSPTDGLSLYRYNSKINNLLYSIFDKIQYKDVPTLFYFTGHGQSVYDSISSTTNLIKTSTEYFYLDAKCSFKWKEWILKISSYYTNWNLWIDCCYAPFTFSEDWFIHYPKNIITPYNYGERIWMSNDGSPCTLTLIQDLQSNKKYYEDISSYNIFYLDNNYSLMNCDNKEKGMQMLKTWIKN